MTERKKYKINRKSTAQQENTTAGQLPGFTELDADQIEPLPNDVVHDTPAVSVFRLDAVPQRRLRVGP